jgi:predicted lipoprotein with Yx(FWY)xxD motif
VRILNYIEPANLSYYGFLHFTDPDVQGTPYVGSFLLAVKGSDGVYEGVFNPKPNPDCDVPYVDSFKLGVEDKLGVSEGLWHPLPQGREKELFREGVIVATQPHYTTDPVTGAYPAGKNYGPKLMYSADGVFYTCTCGCSCGWRQDHLNVKPWLVGTLGGYAWLPWPSVTDMQAWGNTAIAGICNHGDNTYDGVPDKLYMRYTRADCDGGCWRQIWGSGTHHPATILPDFSGDFFAVDANGFLKDDGTKIPDKLALFGRDLRTGKTQELRSIQKTGVITSYVYDKRQSYRRTLRVTDLKVPHSNYVGFPMYDTHEHEHHLFTRIGTYESDYVPSFPYGRFQEKVFDIRRCDCGVCDNKFEYADCSCATREIVVKGWASGKIRSMVTQYAFQCVHDDYIFDCGCRCSLSDIHTYMYAYKSDEYVEVPTAVYLLRPREHVEGVCQCPDYDGRLDPHGEYFPESEIEPDQRDNFYTFTDDCGCACKIAVGELEKHYSPSRSFTFGEEPYDFCPVKQFDIELRQPPIPMHKRLETAEYIGTRSSGPAGIGLTTADRTTIYKADCEGNLVPFHTVCHTQRNQVRQYHDTLALSVGKRVYVFDGGYQMQSCDCFAVVDYFPEVMTAVVESGAGAGEYSLLRSQDGSSTWSMSGSDRQAYVNYREDAYVFVLKMGGAIVTSAMLTHDNYFRDSGVELAFGIAYQSGGIGNHAAWREVSGPLRDGIYRFDVAAKPAFDPINDCEQLPDTALITVAVPEVSDRCRLSSAYKLFWANGNGYASSAIGGQVLPLGDYGSSVNWSAFIAPHALRHADVGTRVFTANIRRSACDYRLPVDFDYETLRGLAGPDLPPVAPVYRDIFAPTSSYSIATTIKYDTCVQEYVLKREGYAGSGAYRIRFDGSGSYRTLSMAFDPSDYLLQSFYSGTGGSRISAGSSVYYDVTATFSDITEQFMEVPMSEVGAYECGELAGEHLIGRWFYGDALDFIVDNFGTGQAGIVAKKTVNHDCTPTPDWYPSAITAYDSTIGHYSQSNALMYYGDYRIYGYTDLMEIPYADFAYDTVNGGYFDCHFEYDESGGITALVIDGPTTVSSCSDDPANPQPVLNVVRAFIPATSYYDSEGRLCADIPKMWHQCQTCDCGVVQMWDVEEGTAADMLRGSIGGYLVRQLESVKFHNGLNKQLIDLGLEPTQHFGITGQIVTDSLVSSFFRFLAIKQVLPPSTVTATLYNSCPFTPTPSKWDYGPYGMLNYDQDYSNATLETKALNGKAQLHLQENGDCACYCCLTSYTPLRDFCLPKDDDEDPTTLPV